jgi:hypothetical protein
MIIVLDLGLNLRQKKALINIYFDITISAIINIIYNYNSGEFNYNRIFGNKI